VKRYKDAVETALKSHYVEAAATRVAGKIIGKVAGMTVQPVIWMANPESDPDGMDVGIWLAGAVAAGPALVTGLVKAMVDDRTLEMLREVRQSEPKEFGPGIRPCTEYNEWVGPSINATLVPGEGGTAWLHPNGLWVYLVDPSDDALLLYEPKVAQEIRSPELPLQVNAEGKYRWLVRRP
jgi:hypothetical protein